MRIYEVFVEPKSDELVNQLRRFHIRYKNFDEARLVFEVYRNTTAYDVLDKLSSESSRDRIAYPEYSRSELEQTAEHFTEFREFVRIEGCFESGKPFSELFDRLVPQGLAFCGHHHARAAAVSGNRLAFQNPALHVQVDRLGHRAGAQRAVFRKTLDVRYSIRIFQKILYNRKLSERIVSVESEHADRCGAYPVCDE